MIFNIPTPVYTGPLNGDLRSVRRFAFWPTRISATQVIWWQRYWAVQMFCRVSGERDLYFWEDEYPAIRSLTRDILCKSCKKGYNGTNGNGYQPCKCAGVSGTKQS